jgi:hypothetical protein
MLNPKTNLNSNHKAKCPLIEQNKPREGCYSCPVSDHLGNKNGI